MASFETSLFPGALDGYWDCCRNGIARLFHIDPVLLDRNLEFCSQPIQHELICLMRNNQVDIIKRHPAFLQQLIYCRRNGPDGESQDLSAVHVYVFFRADASAFVLFFDGRFRRYPTTKSARRDDDILPAASIGPQYKRANQIGFGFDAVY